MIDVQDQHDDFLRQRLEALTKADKDYWSFRGNSRREYVHGLFQYPAMMVHQLARAVLDEACAVHPDIDRVCDPFAGSGTIMTESMIRGLAFTGCDINPLAVLIVNKRVCALRAKEFTHFLLKMQTIRNKPLRNTLLPKLLSAKVTVPGAATLTEEAGQ